MMQFYLVSMHHIWGLLKTILQQAHRLPAQFLRFGGFYLTNCPNVLQTLYLNAHDHMLHIFIVLSSALKFHLILRRLLITKQLSELATAHHSRPHPGLHLSISESQHWVLWEAATLHVHPLCLPSQGHTGPASMGLGCSLPLSLPVLNLQFLYSHFTFPEHYYSTGQGAGNTILALQFYQSTAFLPNMVPQPFSFTVTFLCCYT